MVNYIFFIQHSAFLIQHYFLAHFGDLHIFLNFCAAGENRLGGFSGFEPDMAIRAGSVPAKIAE